MRSIYLSPEHAAFRTTVRAFLQEHVLSAADAWEQERAISREAWHLFGQHGLLGLIHPKKFGGEERDLFHSIVFLEELGRTGYAGIRAGISAHAYMATHYVARYASENLQRSYLTPAIKGDKVAALAITEWDAGSDLSRLATTARPEADRFIIDGTKVFITNGMTADYYVVAVRTSPPEKNSKKANTGISLAIVDARLAGITTTSQEKLGWHGAGTAEIRFNAVSITSDNIIGRLNSGFLYLMRGFQLERLAAAALALGGIERCIESTLAYLTSRQAFDGKLSALQTVRHRITNLATELMSARMLVYHAAWSYQNDELSVTECSMAKLHTTELACRAADECLQLQGARGYLAASDISRIHRDARAATMAGGASEVMRDIIAQQVIDITARS
ncbi:MAG TPA: acyl-CoA dehydrogenase family protein [Rhodocyclaceae bacterium]|nr:acyl-CoA dehydrogenase family protein [Rhodocyclaceae bacterium]